MIPSNWGCIVSIPKLVHWIWFGDDVPSWADDNVQAFLRLHPEWEARFWHELPEGFPDELREIVESLNWYSSRSDILRYWLLEQYGGVYLDTDILTLRNFAPLLEHPFFLAPCLPEGHTRPHLNCALMGGRAGSRVMTETLAECVRIANAGEPIRRITYGPDVLTRLFENGKQDLTLLPSHYFYAIPDRATAHHFWRSENPERDRLFSRFRPTFTDNEEPFAVHLWGVNGSSHRTAIGTAPPLP